MAEIKANGDAIIECADNILELCEKYNTEIDTLFESLSKINQKAWSGDSANVYVSRLQADRSLYDNFGFVLKLYGQVIRNVGVSVNTIISKWENR